MDFCPSLSPDVTCARVSEGSKGAGPWERGWSKDLCLSKGIPDWEWDSSMAGGHGSPFPTQRCLPDSCLHNPVSI